jgi:hypothetical protein
MRESRSYGSEGGGGDSRSLPLSARDQSRNSSLIEVFERVRSSTVFTITAQ